MLCLRLCWFYEAVRMLAVQYSGVPCVYEGQSKVVTWYFVSQNWKSPFFAGGFRCDFSKNNQPNNLPKIPPRRASLARGRLDNSFVEFIKFHLPQT